MKTKTPKKQNQNMLKQALISVLKRFLCGKEGWVSVLIPMGISLFLSSFYLSNIYNTENVVLYNQIQEITHYENTKLQNFYIRNGMMTYQKTHYLVNEYIQQYAIEIDEQTFQNTFLTNEATQVFQQDELLKMILQSLICHEQSKQERTTSDKTQAVDLSLSLFPILYILDALKTAIAVECIYKGIVILTWLLSISRLIAHFSLRKKRRK